MSIDHKVIGIQYGITALLFLFLGSKEKRIIPHKLQLIAEMFYSFVAKMISDTAGSSAKSFFPFIFTLFVLEFDILIMYSRDPQQMIRISSETQQKLTRSSEAQQK